MESLGPVPGTTPYLDVHADDAACWRYTAVMVLVQVLAFGRVSDNRTRRRTRRAAKAEREKNRHEQTECVEEPIDRKSGRIVTNGGLDGAADSIDETSDCHLLVNGHAVASRKSKSTRGPRPEYDLLKKVVAPDGRKADSEAKLTCSNENGIMSKGLFEESGNGASMKEPSEEGLMSEGLETESEASLTETSEEEMII